MHSDPCAQFVMSHFILMANLHYCVEYFKNIKIVNASPSCCIQCYKYSVYSLYEVAIGNCTNVVKVDYELCIDVES